MQARDVVTPVLEQAAARPDHPAFLFGESRVTYGELVDLSRRTATFLQSAGVQKGDRVALMSPNRPEIFSVYLGLAMLGAAIAPINAEYAPNEIRHIVKHAQPRMVIHSRELAGNVTAALKDLPAPHVLQDLDLLAGAAKDCAPYSGPVLGSGRDLVLLCYTSGTTSAPKGVAATHENELASARAYAAVMAITPSDRILATLPLTFSFGFHVASYVSLMCGATICLEPKFNPVAALKAIETRRPSVILGVPTMYAMMADVAARSGRSYDVSSLRLAAASGAAVNQKIIDDCSTHLGLVVRPYYAMTEVRPIFSFDMRKKRQPPKGSVGQRIAPTEVRLVDDAGEDVKSGETGELWVRGPSFSGAYYRDPERTVAVMDGDWFKTGDLAYRDADGNYYIVGRNRDQIISGGANIAPIEVEEALLSHPGIAAAAVVGSPDPIHGQVVKAVIVKTDPELGAEAILAHCKGRIAGYKLPRIIEFREALPMAPSGKILKSELV